MRLGYRYQVLVSNLLKRKGKIMWGEIIVGIVTAVASLLGVYVSNRKSAALITYRMEQLEKKVEKHNNVIERVYRLETKVEELEKHE